MNENARLCATKCCRVMYINENGHRNVYCSRPLKEGKLEANNDRNDLREEKSLSPECKSAAEPEQSERTDLTFALKTRI